ncbi:hypothetical protein P5673_024508, partial [Acropora cervicornis]
MYTYHCTSCQANQVKSSSDMELKAAQNSLAFLKATGLAIAWKSIIRHVCNKQNHQPDPLFKQCVHGALPRRYWLKKGTNVYNKMKQVLMKKLSREDQISCLEGFHSALNQFHPKMICFSWLGTYC